MRYTCIVVSMALLVLVGCGSTEEVAVPTERVELISMTPLPVIKSMPQVMGMKLNVLVHVLKDGTVENVRMLGSSGDSEWDSLAVESMKLWRYAPVRRGGVPSDIWFRQLVVVQIQEPIVMTIGEIASNSLRAADSLFALLERRVNLDPLFERTIGTFDLSKYPRNIRDEVKRLRRDDYTSPIRVGDNYIIYKRFRKGDF